MLESPPDVRAVLLAGGKRLRITMATPREADAPKSIDAIIESFRNITVNEIEIIFRAGDQRLAGYSATEPFRQRGCIPGSRVRIKIFQWLDKEVQDEFYNRVPLLHRQNRRPRHSY